MTRRCSLCGISYPGKPMFEKCRVCERPTDLLRAAPDKDWEYAVELAKAPHSESAFSDSPVAYRIKQLMDCGLSYDEATQTANEKDDTGAYRVDLHKFEHLVKEQGCDPYTAAQILR